MASPNPSFLFSRGPLCRHGSCTTSYTSFRSLKPCGCSRSVWAGDATCAPGPLDPHADPHVWIDVTRGLADRRHSAHVLLGLLHPDRWSAVRWLWYRPSEKIFSLSKFCNVFRVRLSHEHLGKECTYAGL